MVFPAMDQGWKRVLLSVFLIFLKCAVGYEGWASRHVQPPNWPVHERFSLRGVQSSVLEAPVTGSVPVEVTPSTGPGKSLNTSRSRFSLSSQYVKGGFSGSYEPMSHTQSAPSFSASLLQLQGSSSPNAQNVVSQSADRQDSYRSSLSSQDGSGLQGVSALLASTSVQDGSSSGSSILSQSSSNPSTPDSVSKISLSPIDVSGLTTSDQSSSITFTAGSPSSSDLQLGGTSSLLSTQSSSSTGSSVISRRLFTSTYRGSSRPQLSGGSHQVVSASGLLAQSPSTASQNISGLSYSKLAASPLGVSQSTSGQSPYSQYTSTSQSRVGTQLAASRQYVPGQEGSYGSSVRPQGTSSQYAPAFSLGAKRPVSSQYYQATRSGSLFSSQSSQGRKPSTSRTQGFQASSTGLSQGSGTSQSSSLSSSRFPLPSSAGGSISSDSSSVQSQDTSSQEAPAHLGAKVPVYSQAGPSGSSALSQTSQWESSTSRLSQGFQTSGTVASQSSSPSQGSKAPSRFSASPLGVSDSTSGPSSYSQYTSTSQSRAGTQLAGSSHYAPVQTGSTSTDGSSLQLQGTSSLYAPLSAKVPVYRPAAPSGPSLSLSQPSQWQPSSRWSQGFQTSGALASQSSSPSQGSKAPSRFSASVVSPGQFASTQEGNVRYSGLSSQSQEASALYSSGSPAYTKRGSSLLDVSSQSSSGQSSYSQYTPNSQSRTGTQLAGSSPYMPVQSGSTFTDVSPLQPQATATRYVSALGAKVPVYSQAGPSGSSALSQTPQWESSTSRWAQGFQTSGTVASQSSSPSQGSKAPSRSSASPLGVSESTSGPSSYNQFTSTSQSRAGTQLAGSSYYAPVQTGITSTDGSSLQLQGTSSQYAPAFSLGAKQPLSSQYNQATRSGSLSSSQSSQGWQPSISRTQGFQASGTVASQSSSSQGSKAPSRFSASVVSPGKFAATQEESGRYIGLSSQSQSASTLYSSGSPAYAKRGSSLLDVSSQSASGQSSYKYTPSSQSRTGTQLAGSSPYVPVQTGSTSTDGSSLQLQGTSSQYAPLRAKVPVYRQAAPSGPSLSQSQPSQWKTSSRWSQGFQTSGTVALQSGSPSQGSKAPSRFPTLSSAASPGQFASTQVGTQGTSSPFSPGSPAYAKRVSSLDVSSQSTSDQSSPGLYVSSYPLAGSSRHVPAQAGSTFTRVSSQFQGTSIHHAPLVSSQYAPAYPSGSSLTGSEASQKWKPSASTWSQEFQASGTAVPQSSFSPQGLQTSSGSSLPALSPVDSVAQSSISSSRRASSFFSVGLRPSKFSEAASGSTIGSQISPGLSASVQYPSDSMTSSLGSSVQGGSQGIFSGQSSDSTSVISSRYGSTYGQKASGYSRPSQGSFATGQSFSSVKG